MASRDIYYNATKAALLADDWRITADPYRVMFQGKDVLEEFGATPEESDPVLGATKDGIAIAVIVATFTGPSMLIDFQAALGAYLAHKAWMSESDPERQLYLAVDTEVATNTLTELAVQMVVDDTGLQYIVIDIEKASIVAWRPPPANGRL
jgi:XisH protein